LNPPANVYIHWRKDSNVPGEQQVVRKAGNLGRYEPFVDDVRGLIAGAEDNTQTTVSRIPAMVMARVKPIAINYEILVNPFATNAVNTAQIRRRWYEDIASIDPAQRNSHPPCAYISVANELFQ
jgi:hypothetical protein